VDIQINISDNKYDYNTSGGNVSSKKNKDLVDAGETLKDMSSTENP